MYGQTNLLLRHVAGLDRGAYQMTPQAIFIMTPVRTRRRNQSFDAKQNVTLPKSLAKSVFGRLAGDECQVCL
jgi:hypothetical protein